MNRGPVYDRGVVVGNIEDKYDSPNPIARRLMNGFLRSFDELVGLSGRRRAHELGCGEGHLTLRLASLGVEARGSDLSPRIIEVARREAKRRGRDVPFEVRDIDSLDPARDAAPLIVCCEVLEHLPDPDRALDVLSQLAQPMLVASVPREPLWRILNMARGRYLKAGGNTPGHLNHWSRGSFLRFLGTRFDIVEVRSPLPWTVVLGRNRGV